MSRLLRPLVVRGAYCLDGKPITVSTERELADEVQKAMDSSLTSEVSITDSTDSTRGTVIVSQES